MRLVGRVGLLVLLSMTHACRQTSRDAPVDPPTLAILMVIDQLRPDLLERYDHLYVGGLRRLLDEGFHFENATHDHAVTTTGPGHTTLSTGVYPTRHGIVGNSWFESIGGERRSVYSMEDLTSPVLGYPELSGRSSANIYRRGLPDWIAGDDSLSRVVSISRKDRAAIGLAAKSMGEVYWIEERGGEFVTSSFYHSEYPDWITEFNATTLPLVYSDTLWESIVPPEASYLTRPDTSQFEIGGEYTAFPHVAGDLVDASDPREVNHWRWRYTPFPDRAVVSLGIEAIREFQLGQRGSVDYLGIALSQTDAMGHRFGPLSREQLDNLLRLDMELDRFFSFLDDTVGPGRWVVAVSADHGVLNIPEHLAETGVDARRLTGGDRAEVRAHIQRALDGLAEGEAPEDAVKAALNTLPYVAAAYTFSEVESGVPSDSFQVFFAHSHSRERQVGPAASLGVYVRYQMNIHTSSTSQAGHSTPYYYDRHVPVIFFGGGIRPGLSDERIATVDVAPTLAWLVGTPTPDDLDGRVLESVLRRP